MIPRPGLVFPIVTNQERRGTRTTDKSVRYPYALLALCQFNLDVHAGSKVKLHQRIDRLRGRLHDVEHTLVSADLKLFTRFLVNVRTTIDREFLNTRRKRNRTANKSTRTTRRVGDITRSLIQNTMVKPSDECEYSAFP